MVAHVLSPGKPTRVISNEYLLSRQKLARDALCSRPDLHHVDLYVVLKTNVASYGRPVCGRYRGYLVAKGLDYLFPLYYAAHALLFDKPTLRYYYFFVSFRHPIICSVNVNNQKRDKLSISRTTYHSDKDYLRRGA